MNVVSKIKERIIEANIPVLEALKKMDVLQVKLLFVFDNNSFKGLLSIGDIQRAIIRNESLDTPIKNIIRKDITVARISEDEQSIKARMLEFRTECMPVLDEEGELADVYFWEEIFPTSEKRVNAKLDVPVVIMAGGKGTRLKPLTNVLPKPLIPIGENTIMEVIIDKFCQYGICQFYISVNYKHELIRFYFDHIENKGYEINYIKEEEFLGTAGSLFLLKNKIHRTFFVSNCDILVDEDYSEIYKYHVDNKNAITLVASLKHFRIPYGTLESGVNGELLSLQEKPELTYMINTGMYVLSPEVLDQIPEGKFYHITDLIMDLKKNGGKVGVFPVSEKSWFDIGEWPEYQKVIDNYK
jgi:dTDP-glucose pyrophosphorylase/CBS domain-containing protein